MESKKFKHKTTGEIATQIPILDIGNWEMDKFIKVISILGGSWVLYYYLMLIPAPILVIIIVAIVMEKYTTSYFIIKKEN